MGKTLKAQYLFEEFKRANKDYNEQTYNEDKKRYDEAKHEFAIYMFQLAEEGKLLIKTKTGLRYVNLETEFFKSKGE